MADFVRDISRSFSTGETLSYEGNDYLRFNRYIAGLFTDNDMTEYCGYYDNEKLVRMINEQLEISESSIRVSSAEPNDTRIGPGITPHEIYFIRLNNNIEIDIVRIIFLSRLSQNSINNILESRFSHNCIIFTPFFNSNSYRY